MWSIWLILVHSFSGFQFQIFATSQLLPPTFVIYVHFFIYFSLAQLKYNKNCVAVKWSLFRFCSSTQHSFHFNNTTFLDYLVGFFVENTKAPNSYFKIKKQKLFKNISIDLHVCEDKEMVQCPSGPVDYAALERQQADFQLKDALGQPNCAEFRAFRKGRSSLVFLAYSDTTSHLILIHPPRVRLVVRSTIWGVLMHFIFSYPSILSFKRKYQSCWIWAW